MLYSIYVHILSKIPTIFLHIPGEILWLLLLIYQNKWFFINNITYTRFISWRPTNKPETCSAKLCNETDTFWVCNTYVFLCFWDIYEYLYLLCKYSSLVILLYLWCIPKYRSILRNYYWHFNFQFWIRNLVVLYVVKKCLS